MHRDIRPETVFVIEDKHGDLQIQLMSFNSAKQLSGPDEKDYSLLDGLHFCAPEGFNEEKGHGLKVDEFAIGVLGYYLLSGLKYPNQIPRTCYNDKMIYKHLMEE